MADESGESHLPSESGWIDSWNLRIACVSEHAAFAFDLAGSDFWVRSSSPSRASVSPLSLLSAWAGYRVYVVRDAYHQALEDVEVLEAYSGRDLSTLDRSDMQTIQERIAHLNQQITRVDGATTLPFGAGIVERLYWVGPRYEAGRGLIRTARLLTHAGVTATACRNGDARCF